MPQPKNADAGLNVTCGECGHPAELAAASDVWKCNCAVTTDTDCDCDTLNENFGTEDLSSDSDESAESEIARLEARLITLRGGVGPKGETNE